MSQNTLDHLYPVVASLAASLYMIYASICIMRVDSRAERLLAMAVFLLGVITFQLVRR